MVALSQHKSIFEPFFFAILTQTLKQKHNSSTILVHFSSFGRKASSCNDHIYRSLASESLNLIFGVGVGGEGEKRILNDLADAVGHVQLDVATPGIRLPCASCLPKRPKSPKIRASLSVDTSFPLDTSDFL